MGRPRCVASVDRDLPDGDVAGLPETRLGVLAGCAVHFGTTSCGRLRYVPGMSTEGVMGVDSDEVAIHADAGSGVSAQASPAP